MFSVVPNIVLAPNMTQNAERKHRTQNTNTAHIRSFLALHHRRRITGKIKEIDAYQAHAYVLLTMGVGVFKLTFYLPAVVIGGSKGAPGTPPRGQNSFIFMQFSAKNLKNNSTFGSWRTPLGKILDPTLVVVKEYFGLWVILEIHSRY